ncbi:Acetate non-utilizing protein 9, mitochondrial [Leucoagaricus sp. SymC.cos]|nr:Acetate non-utilizing protein 9, mitochondrial [Leucoagaricus sp. SymC.cos]
MRTTVFRLAENVTKAPLNLREASATLLPPISLYRSILRAHRNLPKEMRSLGDVYVKSEFRRHREVTNPAHIIGFLSQWKMYLEQMPDREGGKYYRGKRLDPTVFEKMSSEQLGQLYEFIQSTKEIWSSPSNQS